jgi:hydroxymethylbilane synthase
VDTRLAKLKRGVADATMLARAGLARLGIAIEGGEILDWLPALCQGAIGIEIRGHDKRIRDLVTPIDHPHSHLAVACERGFLGALDGSCRTPIAGLARINGGRIAFRGEVLTADGRGFWAASRDILLGLDAHTAAFAMGQEAAREIRERAGAAMPRF